MVDRSRELGEETALLARALRESAAGYRGGDAQTAAHLSRVSFGEVTG